MIVCVPDMDGMDGKYALMFIPRAREFDRLVSDLKPLAYWKYTNEEWDNFLGESKKEMLSVNKATLRLATIIAAVVGVILIIASGYRNKDEISLQGQRFHQVRHLADHLSCQRLEGQNLLTIKKSYTAI